MLKCIWLDNEKYPDLCINGNSGQGKFCIVKFSSTYSFFGKAKIRIYADVRYMLYINSRFIGRGPVSSGGDYQFKDLETSYYDEYDLNLDGKTEICALVTPVPTAQDEIAFGKPFLFVQILDGNGNIIGESDKAWNAQVLSERTHNYYTDYTKKPENVYKAKEVVVRNALKKSPIKKLCEERVYPVNFEKTEIKSGESATLCLNFDKIYSAYPEISIKARGKVGVAIETQETNGKGYTREDFLTDRDTVHICPRMRSIGEMKITIQNTSPCVCILDDVHIIYSHYPIENEGGFKCSNQILNKIYDVCIHTLKICRQSIHLDSPTHQEPLGCTGDYFIQALMEYMNIYDTSLTRFDILRTAEFIRLQNGEAFHTTYSLIFPEWIYDYYMFSGDVGIIEETKETLVKLLEKFDTYIGKTGLLEKAPNYMFVDWIDIDGYNLHHPPKALGQSVLCMFYYNAMVKMQSLFNIIDDKDLCEKCTIRANAMKRAINVRLFDSEKHLYVGGLNTPNEVSDSMWLPKNTEKKYYLKQANVLAVLYGIANGEDCEHILNYVINDLRKDEMQPYFYHFLFEALLKENLFEKYGMELILKYKSMIDKCDKGLLEAWEDWNGDASHAWGGTPAYILKKAISGFKMVEANYKTIKLSPNLYGLDYVSMEIPTPYGKISIQGKKGEDFKISAPQQINIVR